MRHAEYHGVNRVGWLRATVLGANDGVVSTASLIVGVAAASTRPSEILRTAIAAPVAGSVAMAAGEFVSVSSQANTEHADISRERSELATDIAREREELAEIYVKRGVTRALAIQVADQLMEKDAIGAHARDALGISDTTTARPVQAALASAGTFAVGAAIPVLMVAISPANKIAPFIVIASLVFLAVPGAIGARTGGADIVKGTARVTFWGALAMAATATTGRLFGAVV